MPIHNRNDSLLRGGNLGDESVFSQGGALDNDQYTDLEMMRRMSGATPLDIMNMSSVPVNRTGAVRKPSHVNEDSLVDPDM